MFCDAKDVAVYSAKVDTPQNATNYVFYGLFHRFVIVFMQLLAVSEAIGSYLGSLSGPF